jgi:hypothetical protein
MLSHVLVAYFWNSATVLRARTFPMGFEFSGKNMLELMAMDVFLSWLVMCLCPGDSYPGR